MKLFSILNLYLYTAVSLCLQENMYSGWSLYFIENNISFKNIVIQTPSNINVEIIKNSKDNYGDILIAWKDLNSSNIQVKSVYLPYDIISRNHQDIFENISGIEDKISSYDTTNYYLQQTLSVYLDNINITIYNSNLTSVNQYLLVNKYYLDNNPKDFLQEDGYYNNFLKYFNVYKIDEYLVPIISYLLFLLTLVIYLIIYKNNLCLKIKKLKIRSISMLNIIFFWVYIIWWIGILIYSFSEIDKGKVMIRLGNWITLNLAAVLFPTLRNSMLVILFNISHEKISYVHRILSILCIISVIIKFVVALIFYEPMFLFKIINPTTGGSPLMGTIATLLFITCGILATPIIRKKYFELFYYSHRIISLLVIVFSTLHYMSFLYYILPMTILYFIDLCIRLYHTNRSIYSKLQNVGLESVGTSSTFINITFLNEIKTFPGCYFFICFYKDVSRFEWHPLSMISYSNDTLVFCAKNLGKNSWSNRLFNIVNNNIDILTNRKIYVQGPYGHLSVNYKNEKYNNIIIIAGGIGITPMISILEDINNSYSNNELSHVKKIYFYWIITHMSLYDTFKKYFTNLNKDIFEFKVYTTKKTSITNMFSSDNLTTTFINEKPNVTYILNKIFSKESKTSVVLTCGPKKLTNEVSGICNNFEVDISRELF